jgi:hypothetical protein
MNWIILRQYRDGSTVWADRDAGLLAFCDVEGLPNDDSSSIAGGDTARDWLASADAMQSATAAR